MRRLFAVALVCLAAQPLRSQTVRAETVRAEIGGTAVTLALPVGHCALERSHDVDRVIIETVERVVANTNHVLAAFAECGQRAELREGRRKLLDDYGQYMTPIRGGQSTLPPATFARQMTEVFQKQGAKMIEGAEADTREKLSALRLGIRMGENRLLGVLKTDDRAAYLGIVQALGLPDGGTKVQVGIAAFGLVKQQVLSLNLYSRFEEGAAGANTTLRLLELSTQTYASTAGANE
jgi:hypothetical protein